jgi:hypothetical protein
MISNCVKGILLRIVKDVWWLLGLPFIAFAACVKDVTKGGR